MPDGGTIIDVALTNSELGDHGEHGTLNGQAIAREYW